MSYDKLKIKQKYIKNIFYALKKMVQDLLTQKLLVNFANDYKETSRDTLHKTWNFELERLK